MLKNVTQIKVRITINFGASIKIQKHILCTKEYILGISQQVFAKMVNTREVLLAIQ